MIYTWKGWARTAKAPVATEKTNQPTPKASGWACAVGFLILAVTPSKAANVQRLAAFFFAPLALGRPRFLGGGGVVRSAFTASSKLPVIGGTVVSKRLVRLAI